MQDFKKLKVWQKSQDLMLDVYKVVEAFPQDERFGLARQLKEAAVSIGANLAEGSGRPGDHEFKRFAGISLGSVCEVESHLIASRNLTFLTPIEFDRLNAQCQEVRKMLTSFIRCLSVSAKRKKRS